MGGEVEFGSESERRMEKEVVMNWGMRWKGMRRCWMGGRGFRRVLEQQLIFRRQLSMERRGKETHDRS